MMESKKFLKATETEDVTFERFGLHIILQQELKAFKKI